MDRALFADIVAGALKEDVGVGDITSAALLPVETPLRADLVTRANGVVAGLAVAAEVFHQVSARIRFKPLAHDGDRIVAGMKLAEIEGPARFVLEGERVALNFVQRLSGVATLTRRCVDAVEGCDCRILDTRKTTPGLRVLEKYAVRMGGGHNHRMGLYDQVLIKDNHLQALLPEAGDTNAAVRLAVARARDAVAEGVRVELEAENLDMAAAALEAGADIIMLDNMSDADMRSAAKAIRARRSETGRAWPVSEASGGLTLDRLAAVAATGVDTISLGALTHSAPVLDLALDM